MAECTALTEVFDRLDLVEKENRRLKRARLAVLVLPGVVLLSTLILLAASAVAQVGVPGGVNTPPSGLSGNATQIQGKAVDAPATLGQMPFYNGTKISWFIDPVVRMNRDCGIVGSGDETAALNTCIAHLQNYTGVLQCDKPAMAIHTSGVVIRDKIGIRVETAGGGHSLNNACQLIYTGAAGGTVVDVERTRDSVIFKGFQIHAGAADIGFQTGQTGSGTNIATSDSFEEIQVTNNHGRATFIGFKIGDSTGNNSDEMKFQHVTVTSSGCAGGGKCGTAFKNADSNVYGTEFRNIILIGMAIGWEWTGGARVDKVNGYYNALLYKVIGGNGQVFHVEHEDLENIEQVSLQVGGSNTLKEENGRVILTAPYLGGVTGTAGHPAWDASDGGSLKLRNLLLGTPAGVSGLTLLSGNYLGSADIDFWDPGIATFGAALSPPPYPNALNYQLAGGFMHGSWGNTVTAWLGNGFVDEKGMLFPSIGTQLMNVGTSLRTNATPCIRGNLCLGEGQIEFTGIHSIFNNPTFSYTGTAGSTTRYYAVVACSDTSCAAGNRSIPSMLTNNSAGIHHTAATLGGSNYVTATWIPALGANTYGIYQYGNSETWNLLMKNISCSTNPCTVKITTDSSTYTSNYPADNETGGVILRGAIKMGKSATQVAAVDFTYATVTGLAVPGPIGATKPNTGAFTTLGASGQIISTLAGGTAPFVIASTTPVANLTTVPVTYSHGGTQQTAAHLVVDSCTLGTDCSVTLTGAAVFTSSSSYSCVCQDETAIASCKVAQTSGSAFAIVGRGTDRIRYFCAGN